MSDPKLPRTAQQAFARGVGLIIAGLVVAVVTLGLIALIVFLSRFITGTL